VKNAELMAERPANVGPKGNLKNNDNFQFINQIGIPG
jgi:hypothetical protein